MTRFRVVVKGDWRSSLKHPVSMRETGKLNDGMTVPMEELPRDKATGENVARTSFLTLRAPSGSENDRITNAGIVLALLELMFRKLRKSPEKNDCEQPVALAVADAIPENLPKGSETVLLAEDEETIRAYMALILRDLGYHVIVAADGEQALRLVHEARGVKIDLLLTDIVMPKLSGKELAYQVGQLLPQIKVLFCSGYPEKLAARNGMIDPTVRFLQKPVVPQALAIKVREILDEANMDFPQGTLEDEPSNVDDPTQNGGQGVLCDD